MIRLAVAGDEAGIEAFLKPHAETTMFLRANLARFGLFDRNHPHAMTYWVDDRGGVQGVFARSNTGFVMADGQGADFWAALRRDMNGLEVAGTTGGLDMVTRIREALDLNGATFTLDRPEPLYRLSLDVLRDPGAATIRAPKAGDTARLTDWFRAYHIEALGTADDVALDDVVAARVQAALSGDDVRLLVEDGQPVAMTAFNARLPDMVQIGGVYTPPTARAQGMARRLVAAHLREVRAQGVKTAILFASGAPACRAYEALGFERIGTYSLAILKIPVIVEAP